MTISQRLEICQLGREHAQWCLAVTAHGNVFHSPIWNRIYPHNQTESMFNLFKDAGPLIESLIDAGLSYGVFDTEYQFKRAASVKTGGALCWDLNDLSATSEQLLEQMVFPLVSCHSRRCRCSSRHVSGSAVIRMLSTDPRDGWASR